MSQHVVRCGESGHVTSSLEIKVHLHLDILDSKQTKAKAFLIKSHYFTRITASHHLLEPPTITFVLCNNFRNIHFIFAKYYNGNADSGSINASIPIMSA